MEAEGGTFLRLKRVSVTLLHCIFRRTLSRELTSAPPPSSSFLFITFNPNHPGLSSAQMIRCPQRSKCKRRLICSDHVQSQKRCTISVSLFVFLSFFGPLHGFHLWGGLNAIHLCWRLLHLSNNTHLFPLPPQ